MTEDCKENNCRTNDYRTFDKVPNIPEFCQFTLYLYSISVPVA